jgi:glycerophosphoryl diester phosphodiesterase
MRAKANVSSHNGYLFSIFVFLLSAGASCAQTNMAPPHDSAISDSEVMVAETTSPIDAVDTRVARADLIDDSATDLGADLPASDTPVEISNKPFPPVIAGPDPGEFDCSVTNFVLPGRRSPVPIDCPLNPDCAEPMIVAHRGAGGQVGTIAPENSLYGIRAALLLGVDGVELDIRHTADDQLVLMHDSTVDRTTTGTGEVATMTLSEVTALHLKLPAGSTVTGDFSCATVPTLAAALELTRDHVFIDLDTKTDRIDLVVKAIEDSGLIDQIYVSVGNLNAAIEARALNPDIRIQVRPDTLEEFEEAMASFERPPEIVEIPTALIPDLSAPIRALGSSVFADVWVADAEAYLTDSGSPYLEIFDLGCDIIQSEFPPLPLKALGRWP